MPRTITFAAVIALSGTASAHAVEEADTWCEYTNAQGSRVFEKQCAATAEPVPAACGEIAGIDRNFDLEFSDRSRAVVKTECNDNQVTITVNDIASRLEISRINSMRYYNIALETGEKIRFAAINNENDSIIDNPPWSAEFQQAGIAGTCSLESDVAQQVKNHSCSEIEICKWRYEEARFVCSYIYKFAAGTASFNYIERRIAVELEGELPETRGMPDREEIRRDDGSKCHRVPPERGVFCFGT